MSDSLVVRPVRLIAPAKLTLSLRITGARGDGYHEIDATMVSLDLCDELTLSPGDSLAVVSQLADQPSTSAAESGAASSCVMPSSGGNLAGNLGDNLGGNFAGNLGDNLASAALRLVGVSAQVELLKRIPIGGGLGGGSADAAAILRWFNSTSNSTGNSTSSPAIDFAQACQLGADVGFCLIGGRARVRGIGERIDPLPYVLEQYTLLSPPFGVSSAQVYQAWDRLNGASPDGTSPNGPATNDLEPAAIAVAPALGQWRDALAAQTGQQPILAGSGSTWFVKGHYPDVAHKGVAAMLVTTTDATPAEVAQQK